MEKVQAKVKEMKDSDAGKKLLEEAKKKLTDAKKAAGDLAAAAKKAAGPHLEELQKAADAAKKKAAEILEKAKKAAAEAKEEAVKGGAPEEKFMLIPDDIDTKSASMAGVVYYCGLVSLSLVAVSCVGVAVRRLRQNRRDVTLSLEEESAPFADEESLE